MLRRSGMLDAIGTEDFFTMGDDVMATIKIRLNPTTCANCTVRVFGPCKGQGRKNAPRSCGGIGFSNAIGRPKNGPEKALGRARRGPKYASPGVCRLGAGELAGL